MNTLPSTRAPRVLLGLIALLSLLGTLRAFMLWAHDPLYAYANSYDQTRYTSCFHFYPDRPAQIPPQQNSPAAPYAKYRFIATGDPMCYWSSELPFTAATALIWTVGEALGGAALHDVRWVGALRWLALLALSLALSRAWLRRGDARAALANAALLPLLFADPGNTLYLNTFYAEWSALLAAYALVAATLLWRDAPASRRRFALLALAAFVLATSKIQHLLLPLGLAVLVLLLDRLRHGRFGWRGGALALGALAGLALQVVQRLGEHALGDVGDEATQLAETVGLFRQRHHQQRAPLAADDLDDVAHRAIGKAAARFADGLVDLDLRFQVEDLAVQGGSLPVPTSRETAFFTWRGQFLF